MTIAPSDVETLKLLNEVRDADPRERHMPLERLPLIHAELSRLILTAAVPTNVRQLFETAKNVSLYTYFVYRFHQVSEMVAYAALELALRLKAQSHGYCGASGLRRLLKLAVERGWIVNDHFSSRDPLAYERARMRKATELLIQNPNVEIVKVPEPTPQEVAQATRRVDFISILLGEKDAEGNRLGGVVDQRNDLAHGSAMLFPSSRTTLRLVAETINQLFPGSDSQIVEAPQDPVIATGQT